VSVRGFVRRLQRAGVHLKVDADGLHVDAPRGILSREDMAALSRHAREIGAIVTGGDDLALLDDVDRRDAFEERAAILEHDGRFERGEAERRALQEIRCSLELRLPSGETIRMPLRRGGKA
jgi:hypothetical protein